MQSEIYKQKHKNSKHKCYKTESKKLGMVKGCKVKLTILFFHNTPLPTQARVELSFPCTLSRGVIESAENFPIFPCSFFSRAGPFFHNSPLKTSSSFFFINQKLRYIPFSLIFIILSSLLCLIYFSNSVIHAAF